MPLWSMPSRSSLESKTSRTVRSVRPSRSVRVIVSTEMCPATGSYSNVQTRRSDGTTSRNSPRNACSPPSAAMLRMRHLPPGRTSIASTTVLYRRGPHQRDSSVGSVIALNTMSRDASNSRVISTSVSERTVTFISYLLAVAICLPLFLLLQVANDLVQLLEPFAPEPAVAFQPVVELLERLGPQRVDALLRQRSYLHEPCLAQHAQMLRYLRLAQPQALGDLPDREGAVPEELDD